MKVKNTIHDLQRVVREYRHHDQKIALVPTMGFLHAGHRSLIQQARQACDQVIVTIFVNPTQFGPQEDFARYPRSLDRDLALCQEAGANLVFVPETAEIYPSPNLAYVDIHQMGDYLCGASRPGHFQGVCTVVAKLFNICQPDVAFFGEKDAQQLAIIRQMTADLNFPVEIVGCPIVREPDGLALSSRNVYLNPAERQAALIVPRSLSQARTLLQTGTRDAGAISAAIAAAIAGEPLARLDYAAVVDSRTLQPVSLIERSVLVAIAVFVGQTRLIDNFTFKPAKEG